MSVLEGILQESQIKLDLAATTKEEAIHELVELMATGGGLDNAAAVEKNMLDRESEMSTGLHDGIAVPHCKTNHVSKVQMAVGIKRGGLEFGSMDGKPARILAAIASPASATEEHIKIMSEVARLLRDEGIREALAWADSSGDVLKILMQSDSR